MRQESQQHSQVIFPVALEPVDWQDEEQPVQHERWGWLEVFVLIQVFWGLLLFLPGSQAFRVYIRAFPYLSSFVALIACTRALGAESVGPGARWIVMSLVLMVASLMHPATWLMSGIAQIAFQLSLAAPIFWAVRVWITAERFQRLIWLVFAAHFFSAGLGLLQVYYPETFLPPEFSSLGMKLNPEFVQALTYIGSNDRTIVRPPGLSDMPGGAAISGVIAALLAFGFATRSETPVRTKAYYLGAVLIAITVVYLTQVRSLLLMLVVCMQAVAFVSLRQGRAIQGGWRAALATGLVVASFLWAVTVGGDVVSERFQDIVDSGVVETYQENRGFFLEYTFRELVFEYPFGAGLGRWGMMSVYFGEPGNWQFPSLHAEIQPTGWLYDGGVLMWLFYGTAILLALRNSYRVAIDPDHPLHELAGMALSVQFLIAGLCLTGPAFNTQLGILFWLVTGGLFASQRTVAVQYELEAEEEARAEAEAEEAEAQALAEAQAPPQPSAQAR
jgi:hypothetical protein